MVLTSRGGSAAGPKPGRVRCYLELGGLPQGSAAVMLRHMSSLLPKPFVFVLMPFDSSFDDIYKFGIKGAADDVGAYAERVDEQLFVDGILDRIFNQISKADVIVADMKIGRAHV